MFEHHANYETTCYLPPVYVHESDGIKLVKYFTVLRQTLVNCCLYYCVYTTLLMLCYFHKNLVCDVVNFINISHGLFMEVNRIVATSPVRSSIYLAHG